VALEPQEQPEKPSILELLGDGRQLRRSQRQLEQQQHPRLPEPSWARQPEQQQLRPSEQGCTRPLAQQEQHPGSPEPSSTRQAEQYHHQQQDRLPEPGWTRWRDSATQQLWFHRACPSEEFFFQASPGHWCRYRNEHRRCWWHHSQDGRWFWEPGCA